MMDRLVAVCVAIEGDWCIDELWVLADGDGGDAGYPLDPPRLTSSGSFPQISFRPLAIATAVVTILAYLMSIG